MTDDVDRTDHAVWKFPLEWTSGRTQQIPMLLGATVVHVAVQDEQLKLWAEIDPAETRVMFRSFRVVATGERVPWGFDHRGTVHIDWTVWHVYEARR